MKMPYLGLIKQPKWILVWFVILERKGRKDFALKSAKVERAWEGCACRGRSIKEYPSAEGCPRSGCPLAGVRG